MAPRLRQREDDRSKWDVLNPDGTVAIVDTPEAHRLTQSGATITTGEEWGRAAKATGGPSAGAGPEEWVTALDSAGEPVLLPRTSAQKQGFRVVSQEEARKAGERLQQSEPVKVPKRAPKRAPTRPSVQVSKVGDAGGPRAHTSLAEYAPAQEAMGLHPEVVARVMRTAGAGGASLTDSAEEERPSGDAEFSAAQDEGRERNLALSLSRAGARLNEAISGARADTDYYDGLAKEADSPARRLVAQREADRRKALEDPSSEQSARLRAAVAKALPGVYAPEELEALTAADEPLVMQFGTMRQKLDERRAALEAEKTQRADDIAREDRLRADDRTFRSQEAARARAFQRDMAERNNAADLEQARVRAGSLPGFGARGTTIPGMEIAPGAAPTADDAKKVKTAMAARERLNLLANELESLHKEHGTELFGATAERMGQLTTALQLEAKTLAELGALTGPDFALMQRLTGADPSSLTANLKALVGQDHTQAALKGVREWGGGLADATARTYGYNPAAAPTAPAQPPAAPQRVERNGRVYVFENGQWFEEL